MESKWVYWLAAAVLVILLMISCVCTAIGIGVLVYRSGSSPAEGGILSQAFPTATQTPEVIRPAAAETKEIQPSTVPRSTPQADSSAGVINAPEEAVKPVYITDETLKTLEEMSIPASDARDLARRLEGKTQLPEKLDSIPPALSAGDQEAFWVLNADTNENFQVQATLRYISDHLYFWIQDGVSYDEVALKNLAETFEREIYPNNREFFGSEWTPGVDNDPHLYILYASGLGGTVAGYFSPGDEYLPEVKDFSNGHEMFLLSAERATLDNEYTYGILAHEFQHMIHWYRDRNEDTWVNEGFSDLAMLLNDYGVGGVDQAFASDPDMQLNYWPDDPNQTFAHYGASFLFMTYFLDRFGEQATQALVAHAENGMASLDAVLAELEIKDPLTGEAIGADDVFADWALASYLQDARLSDGRYTYSNYPLAPLPGFTETIDSCPTSTITRDVSQYGTDYIRITCPGEFKLNFEGSIQVSVLPADPHSGDYAFFSNRGDESDMTLTKSFDFRDHVGILTLTYWTWFDLEQDYDYLYLMASTDGEHWEILQTPSGTAEDPSGNSYGWAYNGKSGGGPVWIEEKVDLSQYAGQQVQLRFEYITDAAVNTEGMLLDDISIPEIGYASDFEDDDDGWQADGFVRIQNVLPQAFQVSLIRAGTNTTVERVELAEANSIVIPLALGGDFDEAILVVSGTTRFTRQKAAYQYAILER